MHKGNKVDVIVIGGGPAGLSAAITLSRTKRTVKLFDSQVYRNAKATTANNFPGHEGVDPAVFRAKVRDELTSKYSETFSYLAREARSLERLDTTDRHKFLVKDDASESYLARKVILATGLEDILPPIPGFEQIWGKQGIHCVFCHGTETSGQSIAVLLPTTIIPLFPMLSLKSFLEKFANLKNSPVTILANGLFGEDATGPTGRADLGISEEFLKVCKARGYKWDLRSLKTIDPPSTTSKDITINFTSGPSLSTSYVLYTPQTRPSAGLTTLLSHASVSDLTASLSEPNPMLKVNLGELPVDGFFGKTKTEGIFAAGNAATFMGANAQAVSSGTMAGVGADTEIGSEDIEDELKALAV
ncbi:FAD/NAD(P)-binding domain-containing protein [Atractiella rhizophila]|nr:FAD/NAD(P)-binding domain-containing protein [Atractiella rhizophila]